MDEHYYGAGRVRALEARMLTPSQIARMLAAADFESAFSVLSETSYAENLAKLKHPFDFEELEELERRSLKDLMEHLAPNEDLMNGIKDYVHHKIDLANILTLLRSQAAKKDKPVFLAGGFIGQDILLDLYGKAPQDIISRLSFTVYFPAMAAGIEYYAQHKSFYLLEKLMDDFLTNQARKAKYLTCGIEPLAAFYLAKQAEIKTLRFILICKKNRVAAEKIKERIRASYA